MNLGYVNRFSVKQVNLSCAPQRVIHHLPIERLATFFPLNSHSTNVRTIFGVQPSSHFLRKLMVPGKNMLSALHHRNLGMKNELRNCGARTSNAVSLYTSNCRTMTTRFWIGNGPNDLGKSGWMVHGPPHQSRTLISWFVLKKIKKKPMPYVFPALRTLVEHGGASTSNVKVLDLHLGRILV